VYTVQLTVSGQLEIDLIC